MAIQADITVRSVNGPELTSIVGAADPSSPSGNGPLAARCVYISDGILSGFTITSGHNQTSGDRGSFLRGGGVYLYRDGTVRDCLIEGNRAQNAGGGVYVKSNGPDALIEGCTVAGNTGEQGGGIHACGATNANCIVYGNTSTGVANQNWAYGGSVTSACIHCRTTPLPTGGATACTGSDPQFVGGDDYHPQVGSSCIDAGTNGMVATAVDLDGTPRRLDGDANGTATVGMGCFEHLNRSADSDGDMMTDEFEDDYGLDPTDDAEAEGNLDDDPRSNRDEFLADTDPTSADDYFHITAVTSNSPVEVFFESPSDQLYAMFGCTNLVEGVWNEVPGTGPRAGVGGEDSMVDANDPLRGPFYRMEAELP